MENLNIIEEKQNIHLSVILICNRQLIPWKVLKEHLNENKARSVDITVLTIVMTGELT